MKSQSHTQIQKITYLYLSTQIFKIANPPIMTTTTTNLHFGGQKITKWPPKVYELVIGHNPWR